MLTLAEDPATPLLERAKFLAIFASNLDEFYMVRVAGLQRRLQTGLPVEGPDGLTPREQLAVIADRTTELMARHATCFTADVEPALAAQNRCRSCAGSTSTRSDRERLRAYFREQIFPVLTPLAVDPAHPFPYISGLSLNLAVVVRDPDSGPELFARIKVPNNVPRFVSVDAPGRAGVIVRRAGRRRPAGPVRAGRGAHRGPPRPALLRHADHRAPPVPGHPQRRARGRRRPRRGPAAGAGARAGPAPVRPAGAARGRPRPSPTTCSTCSSASWTWTTTTWCGCPGLLDLSRLWQVYEEVDRPDLKDRPFVPATHPLFAEGETPRSVFSRLRDGDILVHHPYHSFSTSVQRFIEQAAADPNVLAIKQTLYRTSGDSPVVDALIAAAQAGKQVVVLVEVKARFDEQANIGWARMLERAGCHVVYGLVGLKTHCKTAMVVRQEGGQLRRYCHIGTGNYHPKTARTYEDFGLLTADPDVGADLTDLFNVLTGYSRQTAYRRLLVAPHGVRSGIIERIEREIDHVRGRPTGAASRSRSTLLWTRRSSTRSTGPARPGSTSTSSCGASARCARACPACPTGSGCARSSAGSWSTPGCSGSATAGDDEFWIGSADLMHRNLDRRVEALVQITDPAAQAELRRVLDLAMSDRTPAASTSTATAAGIGDARTATRRWRMCRRCCCVGRSAVRSRQSVRRIRRCPDRANIGLSLARIAMRR